MSTKGTLLEVINLVTRFGNDAAIEPAVNDVSFSIQQGRTLALVGESGSGKSVTSLSVMGLLEPPGRVHSGSINYHAGDGTMYDLAKCNNRRMNSLRGAEIAMIFQEPMTSLNPVMKCGEQVLEQIRLHRKMDRRSAKLKTLDLFSEVRLPDPESVYSRYPHQLSGGQKQRVMIAMAMSCEPRLLIADEPTTALDVTVQKTIIELMRDLQRRYGMGILFITHDLGLVSELADDVAVMHRGRIVEQGTREKIFSMPEHPYTRGLLACRPPMNTRPRRLPQVSDFVKGNAEDLMSNVIVAEERRGLREKIYGGKKILSVRNLSTVYVAKKNFFGRAVAFNNAVDDVSFDIFEGETLGLVGESGCGKTTLGRTLLKLAEPGGGEIVFNHVKISELNESNFRPYRKQMQIVFQDPYSSLNPRITIGEAIAEPLRVHGICRSEKERKERVVSLLNKVGLEEQHYGRFPHEFSGGQRQRICIARALAVNPRFIICDESVSALDVSVQAQVLNLLNDLKKELGFTCIFISHDLGVVKFMSDRMLVMNKGKIVEEGDPDEIYRNPSSPYTKKLIESVPGTLANSA